MSDLISRQAAIKTLEKGLPSEPLKSKYTEGITVGFGLAITWIEQLPAVQSERLKGKWIPQDHNKTNGMASTLVYYYPKCSVCGYCDNYTNFCPNCGADMREDGD